MLPAYEPRAHSSFEKDTDHHDERLHPLKKPLVKTVGYENGQREDYKPFGQSWKRITANRNMRESNL